MPPLTSFSRSGSTDVSLNVSSSARLASRLTSVDLPKPPVSFCSGSIARRSRASIRPSMAAGKRLVFIIPSVFAMMASTALVRLSGGQALSPARSPSSRSASWFISVSRRSSCPSRKVNARLESARNSPTAQSRRSPS